MAGGNHDTTWQYETSLEAHANYVASHIMDLINATLMLVALVAAELVFSFFAL